MEILVILMFAAIFFAITMFIVSFIMLRKRHNDKVSAKGENNYYLDDDDDDDDEEPFINNDIDKPNEIVSETIDNNEETLNIESSITEQEIENVNKNDDILLEEVDSDNNMEQEMIIEETNEVLETNNETSKEDEVIEKDIDIIVPNISETVTETKETDLQQVVNVLINKKNYIFLANDNVVNKGDHVKVLLNKKIYYGLITKANYERDINAMKVKPRKLVIIKDNKNSKKEEIEVLDTELEFIPKKKQK